MKAAIVYTDGGSRGNPGPAAAAYHLSDGNKIPFEAAGIFLGRTTNNIAEYTAVIKGLQAAHKAGAETVRLFCDSELVVKQLNGEYKVKHPAMKELHQQCRSVLDKFSDFEITHVRRHKNTEADGLVNKALDLGRDVTIDYAAKRAKPPKPSTPPVRLGVLLSGGGRTMVNLQEQIESGNLNAEIAVVISSRSTVKGIERAKAFTDNIHIVRKKDFDTIESFSGKLYEILKDNNVDLVVQAGWLCLWHIPDSYTDRVMNIHPALLPSFGGQGMWGHHVHEAVLARGCKISGCTVHFCTNEYDQGPIIVQRCCPVSENDDPDSLADRVFEQECIAYPEAVKLFVDGRLSIENGTVKIAQAKQTTS